MSTPPPPMQSQTQSLGTQPALGGAEETTSVGTGEGLYFGEPAAAGEVGVLGPYRIVKELGRGGMGAVYAAIDTRLDRQLALKLMLPQFAANPSAKERFLREARAAAKINHDNVVTVYEADERSGIPYIAMQFLRGYPLDEFLKKKGLPSISQALRIASETAAGLAAAHQLGLVHRDIKPGNLWLEAPNGRVKVLDFGLARPVDADVELTKSGAVVGTPAYMSPEQARGEKVDHRTDLFSLGAVLYKLCTGRLPFNGPTTMAVLMALGTEEPKPVRELNPEVPESLAALIHQLLAKRAGDRPQSATEVVKRVRAILEELKTPLAMPVEQSTSLPQVIPSQVVYVPIPVTVHTAQNPFADLDAPAGEVEASHAGNSSSMKEPESQARRRKPARRFPWTLAGALAFAALALGAVIIVIRHKDGTETKIEVPDGATVTVTVNGNASKPRTRVGPGKNRPAVADADRKAAEWALSLGGAVQVNGDNRDIKTAADLPKDKFRLTCIDLHGRLGTEAGLANLKGLENLTYLNLVGAQPTDSGLSNLKELKSLQDLRLSGMKVTDAGLMHLKELKNLTSLHLVGAKVTDAGLTHLKELKNLSQLNLVGTQLTNAGLSKLKELKSLQDLRLSGMKVTDAGLMHLKELKNLTSLHLVGTQLTDVGLTHLKGLKNVSQLNLFGTQLTDAGLTHLKELKSLTDLSLKGTQVTAKGVAEFHAAVPGCKILYDGGEIAAIDTDADRAAAEWALSLGGSVQVNGVVRDIKVAADLPKGKFKLTWINLHSKAVTNAGMVNFKGLENLQGLFLTLTQVTDAGLTHLRELKSLTFLELSGTKITDAGLPPLKYLKSLTHFNLAGSKVTDAGLAHLKDLKSLAILNLGGTQLTNAGLTHLKELKNLAQLKLISTSVSDAGLTQLKELKSLTYLDLSRTKVTAKGLAEFHAAVPGCRIVHDGGEIAAIDTDADRAAAEWALSLGGSVQVNGVARDIKAAADLPKGKLTLMWLNLNDTKATDEGLKRLKNLKKLVWLNLSGTQVTDAGLAHLKDIKGLSVILLNNIDVTDTGLAHLKEIKSLAILNLQNAKVTDAGLAHLKELKNLKEIGLRGTKVTAKGMAEFHAAVPGCKIEQDKR